MLLQHCHPDSTCRNTLWVIIDIAERSAVNADWRHCAGMLSRALDCKVTMVGLDATLMDRLTTLLEEALAGLELKTIRETADLLARAKVIIGSR